MLLSVTKGLTLPMMQTRHESIRIRMREPLKTEIKSSTLMWRPLPSLDLLMKQYSGIPQPISPTYLYLYFAGRLWFGADLNKYLRSPVFSNAGRFSPM